VPFYSFHLDVPAPPDVVVERLRVAVGRLPSYWERLKSSWKGPQSSHLPFMGSIEGRTFRIRRSIQYRNSFLPLMRGSIVPESNGSRVNVFMYMHPLAIVSLLFLGLAEWQLVKANITRSFVPGMIIVFGLALIAVRFFYEALRTIPLFSEAVFNPSITEVPKTSLDPSSQAKTTPPERHSVALIVGPVALLVLLAGLGLFKLYDHHLRACPAFSTALDLMAHSVPAQVALGKPVRVGFVVRGVVHANDESGYAILTIPVHGPTAKGSLYVVANREGRRWDIERAVLHSDNGSRRIDLTPPVQPEHFRYHAPGRVSLLPLDKAAAFDLQGLPQYFEARLGLNVTLLPPQQLPKDAVDPKTKQVIAEKAIDSIVEEHREIANDLDSVILGVTSQDMNIWTSGWKFATNYRHGRFGIVSTTRLHRMPWYAGANPEVFAIRVRKMATKNVALLHYPVDLSADVTSALAASTFTASDIDEMGESFGGENGRARSIDWTVPCVTISQNSREEQSWRLSCTGGPPADSRFEVFITYPGVPLFEMSRTDFPFDSYSFVRKYRTADDLSRAFGIGATDSFDIFPVGDSQTFSSIELILADGRRIHYTRFSPGEGVANAKLRAGSYMGSPFSLSSLAWNGNGWDLATKDGWTYKFPASGPGKTWQQSALIGIRSGSGKAFSIDRGANSDLREIIGPDGRSITIRCDTSHRIISAKESSGRTIEYEYDMKGRLVRIHDSQNGDEFYKYDPANRLTSVLDRRHRPLLTNTYGFLGEIRSQTLADGRKLVYVSGYDESHRLDYLKLTLPNGYTIEWNLTRYGFTSSLPTPPLSVGTSVNP
jgi:YD repeat-containing protein